MESYRIGDTNAIKGCVVLNANPCTKGHIHLITEALKEVDYLYKRSKEMLDREKKWKESNDSVFSNMELEITIRREVPLAKGCKVTG